MKNKYHFFAVLSLMIFLSGCAELGLNQPEKTEPVEIRRGIVEQVNYVQVKTNHDTGLGAVIGGVGGALLGGVVGAGTGRDVAMVAGALGGAAGGNAAEKKHYDQPKEAQQVIVRLRNGVLISVTQPINPNVVKGRRVYIEGQGENAIVVPQNN